MKYQRNQKTKRKNKNRSKNKKKRENKNKRKSKKMRYTRKDYKSGEGMLTSVWGPSLWHSLHTISFNYPVKPSAEQKREYRKFMLSLKHILPCKYCRINYRKNLKALPLTMKEMESRDTFSLWVYKLHEHVNQMLKKKSGLSYNDVRDRYEHFRARCGDKSSKKEKNKKTVKYIKLDLKTKKKMHQKQCKVKKTKRKYIKKEKGCTQPYYGKKSKCIIKIVPKESKMSHSFLKR